MIDLMKRLAELDSKNPTIVKENQVDECGMMPEMGMDRPSTPASINVTAGSGEELGNVLKDIMSLAGVKQVGAEEPLSAEPEPVMAIDVEPEQDMDPNSSMRSVMDLMNEPDQDMGGDDELETDDEEEADEGQYDNSPASPIKPPMFSANQYANRENQPGQGDRMDGNMPKAYADMNEATRALFAEYKRFVSEAYNPNSAGATHSREVNASHKAELEKKANAGDEGAKKRLAAMKDKEETRRNDRNDRMERESVDDSMSPLEQQIRDRLEELHDEMEPEYAYEQAAHEFGMSQEELQHKLAHGFDNDSSSMMESKPSAGMTKGEKSSLAKKASAGKDIGKPGKSFDKVAKAAGGGEKGKRIAAAAMWKNAAKK